MSNYERMRSAPGALGPCPPPPNPFNEKEIVQQIGKNKIQHLNLKYKNIEKRELEEFARCIKYKKKFPVDLNEVLENTKLFQACVKSKKNSSKFIKV